jgi:hypothetical protein
MEKTPTRPPGKNFKRKKHQQEHKGYKRKAIDILFFITKKKKNLSKTSSYFTYL